MILFFAFFVALYGSVHVYAFFRTRSALGLFDLQLSGHTHKGQLFPFTWLTFLSYPMNAGRYDLGKGSLLYVNRGAGTWGSPIRVFAPPEVAVIQLVRKQ